jgi:ABC-type nitrate/sulfonate/bicarbonate transport system substrate-binding protein
VQDAAERRASGLGEPCRKSAGQGTIMGTKLGRIRRPIVSVAWLWLAILPAAADPVTLRYGQIPSTARSVSTLYLSIARQKGFLDHEQIRLELVPIAGGTDKMVAALDRGEVDVTQTATPYLIRAALSGSDATAIAGETANPVYSLIAKPQIQNFAELKGKTLGLSLPVDTISISMRKLLALKGLGEADYSVKELVGTPVRFDCLKRGECDAVPLGQPEDFVAIGQGYRRLGVSTEAVEAFQFQVIAARRAWAQANKAAVVRFLRAVGAAFRFIRDPANRGGGDEGDRGIDRLFGRDRAPDARALFRTGQRRHTEARRDRPERSGAGDFVPGRGRRHQAAAAEP